MNNYGYGLSHSYFDQEAEEIRQEEYKWERIIGDIGEGPFFKIDGFYFGEEQAIHILNEDYGDDYDIDQWEVEDDEVFERYLGGIL